MKRSDLRQKYHDLDLNLLTFRLIVLTLPFEYILDLLGGTQSAVPPSQIIEVGLLAVLFMVLDLYQDGLLFTPTIKHIVIIWFLLNTSCVLILTHNSTVTKDDAGSVTTLFIFFVAACLVRALWRTSLYLRGSLALLGSATFPWLFIVIPVELLFQAVHNLRYVYDPVLYRIDDILVFGWVNIFPDIFNQHSIIKHILTFSYFYIPFWGLLAAISQKLYKTRAQAYLLFCLFTLGIVGFPLYYLMPAVAPFFFFGSFFPDNLPDAQTLVSHQVISPTGTFRNTMPSLHAATSFLIYLAVKDSPAWHRGVAVFVVFSVLISTLALGYHYVVDLIAAFPLVLLVRGICSIHVSFLRQSRSNAVFAGAILISLWVLVVRNGVVSLEFPWLIRLLSVLSVVLPMVLEHRLTKVERMVGESEPKAQPFGFMRLKLSKQT